MAFRASGAAAPLAAGRQALESGDFSGAARALGEPTASLWSEVQFASCATCGSASVLSLTRFEVQSGKTKQKELVKALLPRAQVEQLLAGRQAAA